MKAKLITAAALTLAGLGAIASNSVLPTDSQRSEPGPAEGSQITVTEKQPVETPLVEKLLVKSPEVSETRQKSPQLPVDGERTADGFFKYEAARNIFVPVDHGHPRYTHDGHRVGLEHLIAEHGHARSSAEKWDQEELEIAHANSHWWEKTRGSAPQEIVYESTSCPNGQCGNPSRSRGLFRRR